MDSTSDGGPIYSIRRPSLRIALRSDPLPTQNSQDDHDGVSKQAWRMRLYRQEMKDDPDRYKLHREIETMRVKEFRDKMLEETKTRYREKSCLRQQKYRQRLKETPQENRTTTRKEKAEQTQKQKVKKEYWRQKKREQRAKMNPQQKRREREQRCALYALKKRITSNTKSQPTGVTATCPSESSAIIHMPSPTASTSNCETVYSTKDAKRKAVKRVKNLMPNDAKKYAEVIESLIEKATPKKKNALGNLDIKANSPRTKRKLVLGKTVVTTYKDRLRQLAKKRTLKANRERRNIAKLLNLKRKNVQRKYYKELGFSWSFLCRISEIDKEDQEDDDQRKPRSDKLEQDTVRKAEQFYMRSDVSRENNDKRNMSRKSLKSTKFLEMTVKTAYKQFRTEHPENDISYDKFAKLRPSNVKTMGKNTFFTCLCEYCTNVEMKLTSLKSFSSTKRLTHSVPENKYEASRLTLCEKENNHYKVECLHRSCRNCGIQQLDNKFQPLTEQYGENMITWRMWENQRTVFNGKTSTRKMLKEHKTTINVLISNLKDDIATFSLHLANAQWQSLQFEHLRQNIPKEWILYVMDYAENYTCNYQDEIQSAHWSQEQATIHPVVSYYRCPKQNCTEIVHESVVFISDDRKHDCHGVQHFVSKATDYFMGKGIEMKKQIHFSDGCAGQYKGKFSFVDASFGKTDFGCEIEKHFFGSRHGKGPCDSEIGVIKRVVSNAVVGRNIVIDNAESLFKFCKENLTKPKIPDQHDHAIRTFIFVHSKDILRNRPERTTAIRTLKDTRKHHCIRGIDQYIIATKIRSCFCQSCINEGQCEYGDFTMKWDVMHLRKRTRRQDIQPVEEQELAEAQPMEDDQQQAQVVQQAREDQHAQGYQQQMTGPDDHQRHDQQQADGDKQHDLQPVELDTSFNRLIENVNISFDMFDDSREDISINFSDIDRILDESDREKEGKRLSTGDCILVKHGSNQIPAVVTRPKDENFFNIKYYKKRPNSSCDYTLNEEEYIISKDDIDRLLDPPDIKFSGGSRFYFNFKF